MILLKMLLKPLRAINVLLGGILRVKKKPVPAPEIKLSELPLYYVVAKKELGVHEKAGWRRNEDRIIEYHATTTLAAKRDEVPWCSSFVNWCVIQAGLKGTDSALARSWMKWGREVKDPSEGCVVIFNRGLGRGHVGFFVEECGDEIIVLGGNQSNAVSLKHYSKKDLLGFREA